jgi:hypothetical protein
MKRVLPIRLSSKYRGRVKRFVYDLVQFQNLLRIFVLEWDKKTGDILRALWFTVKRDGDLYQF